MYIYIYIYIYSKFLNYILNYKVTVFSIDTNDDITQSTGIIECDCQQHENFADENHGHVLAGDPRILANSKLNREAILINWNKCKNEMEIGLDSRIKGTVSTNLKVTTEEFVEWKIQILQEVDNKS